MAKKLIVTIIALIGIIALILPGCAGGGPQAVTVTVLERTEDQRLDIGHYVSSVLEGLGFTVVEHPGTSRQLSSIWMGDPTPGLWNVYTAAWINTAVPRDEGSNFGFFYTPLGAYTSLWSYYINTPEFLIAANKLWTNDFADMTEREEIFDDAVPLSMEDSVRIFLDDRNSFAPLQEKVGVAADLCGGIEGSGLWAPTIHFRNATGTPLLPDWDGGVNGTLTMRIAMEDLIIQPWNAVAGSNWAFDQFPIRGTGVNGYEYDTNNGLAWPHVAGNATVEVLETLPMSQSEDSEDWLTVTTSPTLIPVPTTAWADWNATSQTWITAGPGVTAKTKTVVYYPEGTFDRPLHDGSTLDEGDFLLWAILQFDRGKSDSLLYDEDAEYYLDVYLTHFKGMVFNFTDPSYDLVVTTYDDQFTLDAELMPLVNSWYPSRQVVSAGQFGEASWPALALGILGEDGGTMTFSQGKSSEAVEWTDYISGPSLADMADYLDDVLDAGNTTGLYDYIPYKNVLGAYISAGEANARYTNLKSFYDTYEHLWVGSGPYFLSDVDTTAKVLVLDAFQNYAEDGDQWFFLMDPAPVSPPEHQGAWVDEVTLEILDHLPAINSLQDDDLDVYAAGLADPDIYDTVMADPDLYLYMAYGLFDELTLNPSGPLFLGTGKLNPFAYPEIREALNMAIDRSHIKNEIFGGFATERFTCVATISADYLFRYNELITQMESDYAYDFAAANATIYAAMMAINGTTCVDGKYYYEQPA
jgi:peptide/nickel transport system substrate-binding protein